MPRFLTFVLAFLLASPLSAAGLRKNVASQEIGAQLVSATDGSAFTGSVTVSVTGDAGTQATGSVGSGACTHEGNGYHTYTPSQAETNYDLVAFTFTGSGAVPVTVQVFTFTQGSTGQPAVEITSGGLAAAAFAANSITAATLAGDVATELQSGLATAAALSAVDDFVDDLEGRITSARAGYLDLLEGVNFSTAIKAAVGMAESDLDTQLAALPTADENRDELLTHTLTDTGATTTGRTMLWLYNTFSSIGVFDTPSLANAPAGGGSLTDVDQEAVPTSRIFKLVRDEDGGLNAEDAKSVTVGEDNTFAVDFAADMAVNERIATVSPPTIASGTADGITFDNLGRDKSQAKFRVTPVTAGDYVIHVTVEYRSGATTVGIVRFTVVD